MAADGDSPLLLLHPRDNVLVARRAVPDGAVLEIDGRPVRVRAAIALGHKVARVAIPEGAAVVKYAAPIGLATQAIAAGEHVHLHNLRSAYTPTHIIPDPDGAAS